MRLLPRRQAFTLVELLVVIGIIAVLISILLPALTSARKQASAVKCLSHMRQFGMAFGLYASEYKGAFPVVRQDYPDNGITPVNQINVYWTDMLAKYVTAGKMNFQIGSQIDFDMVRKSVLWGCPEWDGFSNNSGITASTMTYGASRFDNGIAMNPFPTASASHPIESSKMPPGKEMQMRTTVIGAPDGSPAVGRYYKQSQWTKPSERLLLVDASLWLLGFNATTVGGAIQPQNAIRTFMGGPGQNNVDRYRHGKYPPISGTVAGVPALSNRGGKVAYNILYVDGHGVTSNDIRDAYRGIRMRDPG
jgi:prepilin-type N-terminal cleavage/methylation domain-containing protein/prepilin-type processing-associated H-X9-DG protein